MNVLRIHLLILLLVSVGIRVVCHGVYLPWWVSDSSSYAIPAWAIYTNHLDYWDGARTPGYPLFLIACQLFDGAGVAKMLVPSAAQMVTWAQSLLGVISVFLLYFTMERLQIRPWVQFTLALLYSLLVIIPQYEMMVLSEPLCLFYTTSSVYFMALTIDCLRHERSAFSPALLAGIASGSAILVRPNVLFIWIVFIALLACLALVWAKGREASAIFQACRICLAAGGSIVGLWLIFNYENTTDLTLSPLVQAQRVCPAYNLFNQVHPEDKVLGEIMVKYYHQTTHDGTVMPDYWTVAFPEILRRYNEMPVPKNPGSHGTVYLSQYFLHVGNYLLAEHPGVWLQNSWFQLQRTTTSFMQPDAMVMNGPISLTGTSVIISRRLSNFLGAVMDVQSWFLLGLYLATYAAGAIAIVRLVRARNLTESLASIVPLGLAVATLGSVLAFCVFAVYYIHYSIPLLPLFIICTGYIIESCCLAVAKSSNGFRIWPPNRG